MPLEQCTLAHVFVRVCAPTLTRHRLYLEFVAAWFTRELARLHAGMQQELMGDGLSVGAGVEVGLPGRTNRARSGAAPVLQHFHRLSALVAGEMFRANCQAVSFADGDPLWIRVQRAACSWHGDDAEAEKVRLSVCICVCLRVCACTCTCAHLR